MTSKRRSDVVLTPWWHYYCVMCPLGWGVENIRSLKWQPLFAGTNEFITTISHVLVYISDTTWTLAILYWLSKGCKAGRERTENMDDIFLFVEVQAPDVLDKVMKKNSPRNIKTHLGVEFFKGFLNNPSECPTFIVVMRDVRDCHVSYYHFVKLLNGESFACSFDEFLALYYANRVPYGDIIEYDLGWWAYRDHPKVFIVQYEDMLRDSKGVVMSLGEFIKRPVDGATAVEITVTEGCPFAQMQGRAKTYHKEEYENDSFFRKGKKGDWRITSLPNRHNMLIMWSKKNVTQEGCFWTRTSKSWLLNAS